MSDVDRAPSDPSASSMHASAADAEGKDVAGRAADLADNLYVRAERERRRESLDELLSRGTAKPAEATE